MDLLSLINNCIYLDIEAQDSTTLFDKVGAIMETHDLSASNIAYHLNMREALGSTALGFNVAIPHGRIKGLKQTRVSIIRTKIPIEFKAPDGLPVNVFINILVPEHATQEHLNLLSYIAIMLSDEEIREIICTASTAEDILQAIQIYAANNQDAL